MPFSWKKLTSAGGAMGAIAWIASLVADKSLTFEQGIWLAYPIAIVVIIHLVCQTVLDLAKIRAGVPLPPEPAPEPPEGAAL